ncbi:MAG: hypothetical protein QHH18_05175 [Candidatus Bathyarchaeota archaeon]|jgi:hypothetical protein|nr:hypothetical protein [Candidatus Bathyarchaeota archaeon A05DMB-5]MDH7557981.1 hypothetical protein [Candidatus Bathyarchaeota archaeon]
MKTIVIFIRQREISKVFPDGLRLILGDNASIIDVIKAVDLEIKEKASKFPIEKYKSLLHMVYNPHRNRFYNQVAIHAYAKSTFLNVRENPLMPLPNETTIVLIPENGCQTDWEEPVE